MKPIVSHKKEFFIGSGLVLAVLLAGCASDPKSSASATAAPVGSQTNQPPEIVSSAKVSLHKDKDIQGIWVAPGFNFKGYDALYVEYTVFKGKVRDNETEARTAAIGNVQSQFVIELGNSDLFPKVLYGSPENAPGKNLRLVNTIIEYEKGGGGARYFIGLYGGGQPKIKVRGELYDGDKLVFVFEAKRSGEGADAHFNGVFKSDIDIQTHDIFDMARDLAACMKRNSGS